MGAEKHLKIAGILEILIGLSMIGLIQILLRHDASFLDLNPDGIREAFQSLLGLYALHVFEIVAGIFAIVKSKGRSLVIVICGAILFFLNLTELFLPGEGIGQIVVNVITLLVPYYYLHNAVKIYRNRVE